MKLTKTLLGYDATAISTILEVSISTAYRLITNPLAMTLEQFLTFCNVLDIDKHSLLLDLDAKYMEDDV